MGDVTQLRLPGEPVQEPQPQSYWLTVCSMSSRCDVCGRHLAKGDDIVYRYDPKRVLCLTCAANVEYRASRKWRREPGAARCGDSAA